MLISDTRSKLLMIASCKVILLLLRVAFDLGERFLKFFENHWNIDEVRENTSFRELRGAQRDSLCCPWRCTPKWAGTLCNRPDTRAKSEGNLVLLWVVTWLY